MNNPLRVSIVSRQRYRDGVSAYSAILEVNENTGHNSRLIIAINSLRMNTGQAFRASMLILLLSFLGWAQDIPARSPMQDSAPPLFSFDELLTLSDTAAPKDELGEKLRTLLNTPFVGNQAARAGMHGHRAELDPLGPVLRVTVWNIERGTQFPLIRLAMSDANAFLQAARNEGPLHEKQEAVVREEVEILAKSDLLILNEVDLGMTRSGYRDVAKELAEALNMNYAFGVEFVEIDKIELGLERLHAPNAEADIRFVEAQTVDRSLYNGLHGSAILSRYPIRSARIFRFTRCYDWFGKEKAEIAALEKGKRLAADRLFLERIGREVRHGERMAIITEVEVPESPTGLVTVVNAHLENKCIPACRQQQMRELLAQIRETKNPVVLGGDLNSTGSDGAPLSISREVKKRVKNPNFWAGQAVRWSSPVALPQIFVLPTNYFKNYQDPTARNIPLVASNAESGLFNIVREFTFSDGKQFDFEGDKERSANGRAGTLSNSNERARKGFTSTFTFKRDFKGAVGRMRLDWIFVKPPAAHAKLDDHNEVEPFAPYFGRTLSAVNTAVPEQISDHHPVIVNLPLSSETKPLSPNLALSK